MIADLIDVKILQRLMYQGRATWAELAEHLGLSAPSVAERVRKLEVKSVITGYAALVDPAQIGYPMTAFIFITMERPRHRAEFVSAIGGIQEIVECHHLAGDDDYLLKVRCKGTADLDHLLSERLKAIPGISRTRTTIVLSTLRESVVTPLDFHFALPQ